MVRRGTYSIVARDETTGALGVAVQSHWFSVGSIVAWGEPGAGVVATQSIAEPAYGPWLLERLRGGQPPRDALDELLARDEQAGYRQVAVIGPQGPPAVHTGPGCIAFAGHASGTAHSAQANMMASQDVWPAMSAAFEASGGPLARRLLSALRAAEDAGGDVRGRQSSCLVVVRPGDEPWRKHVDLRVEDHPEPLDELKRLLTLHDAYELATQGDDLVGEGRHEEAGAKYEAAAALAPGNHELLFWAGLAAVQAGDDDTGMARVREAIALQPGWRDLLERLTADVAPAVDRTRSLM